MGRSIPAISSFYLLMNTDLSREHLNRVHKVPVYCERCKLQFKTAEALKSHLIVPDTEFCKLKEGPIPDGIGPELAIKLKSRKRSSPRQSESERWKDIFRLLFPEELVPMPCKSTRILINSEASKCPSLHSAVSKAKMYLGFDPIVDSTIITADESQTLSFGEFYRQELPRIFRAHLNATVNKKLKTLDDCFKTELVNMVKTCQSELASQWRFNHGNVGCPPFRTSIQASNLHNQAQLSGIPQQAGSNVRENPELQSCGKSEDKTAQNCKSTMEQSTFPQALPPESSLAVPGLCFCTGQCDCLRATGPTSTLPTTFGDLDMMTSQYEMDWSADMFNISWLDNSLNASSGTAFDTEP